MKFLKHGFMAATVLSFGFGFISPAHSKTMFEYCGEQEDTLRSEIELLAKPSVPLMDLQARNKVVTQKLGKAIAKDKDIQLEIIKYAGSKSPKEKGKHLNAVEDFLMQQGLIVSGSQTQKLTKCATGFHLADHPENQWSKYECQPQLGHLCYSRNENPCISDSDPKVSEMPLEETGVSEAFMDGTPKFMVSTNIRKPVSIVFREKNITLEKFDIALYFNAANGSIEPWKNFVFPHGATVTKADGSKTQLEDYFNDYMRSECRDFHSRYDSLNYKVDKNGDPVKEKKAAVEVPAPVKAATSTAVQ